MSAKTEALPTCSLIISTYNWPEALYLCLKSVLDQVYQPNEIIIADDGSTSNTANIIADIQKISKIPIVHVWQPDEGFQLSKIRNKAIKEAKYDYIIQVDGDIILHNMFVFDHLTFARKGTFLCGSRVSLPKERSENLLRTRNHRLTLQELPLGFALNGLRFPLLSQLLADTYKKNQLHVLRGCNMSFWRQDLLDVNGYNEDITGWGSEDFELAMRLINRKIGKRFIKFMGIVYHIYHVENSRQNKHKNNSILQQTIEAKSVWAENGIFKP